MWVPFFEKSLGFSAKLHLLPNKDLAKFGPFLCKLFLVRAILSWREQSLSLNDYSLQLQIVHTKKCIQKNGSNLAGSLLGTI